MITGDFDMLTNLTKTHHCPLHDNPLNVAWDSKLNSYVLRCGAGHDPEEVTPVRSVSEEYRQTDNVPEPIRSIMESKRLDRAMAGKPVLARDNLVLVPPRDLGDNKLLTPEQVKGLVAFAIHYGLDPYRHHVYLMYGQPYIGIDGYLYHANLLGKSYKLLSRPLTADERAIFQLEEGTHAWKCEVLIAEGNGVFTGIGIVRPDELTARSPNNPAQLRSPVVARHPWQLAQKRAEWQALRRAFPIGEEAHNEDTR